MENKIYQACREDAYKLLVKENPNSIRFNEQLAQLTAELYAQKFADWIQPMDDSKPYYHVGEHEQWVQSGIGVHLHTPIGTTAQLHEKFVEENKGGGDE